MSPHTPPQDDRSTSPTMDELVQAAGFIFAGTVQQVDEVALAGSPPQRAAVVRVSAPLHAPALLHASVAVGREVTIALRAPVTFTPGQTVLFFANSWVYGRSLALRELGHLQIGGSLTRLRQDIVEARVRLQDGELRRRLATAPAIVAGTVAQTVAASPPDAPAREHDPHWIEAVIAVTRVLRGPPDKRLDTSVVVLCAGSRHIRWRHAPKLYAGQQGIWILRQDLSQSTIKEPDREVYALLDPRDSWPLAYLDYIQTLLDVRG